MASLSHRQPGRPAPLAGQDLGHALMREASDLRRIATACDIDDIRDALTGLASQCEAAGMVVLRHRRRGAARTVAA